MIYAVNKNLEHNFDKNLKILKKKNSFIFILRQAVIIVDWCSYKKVWLASVTKRTDENVERKKLIRMERTPEIPC